jgi:DNA-binding LacI/PurR family transcriptional regulator
MIPRSKAVQNDTLLLRRASRRDVARLAGVSPTTITHVLQGNPKTRVSPATRERILRVVRETSYTPHALASAVDGRRTKHIAVVAAKIGRGGHSFLDMIFDACRETAQAAGYYVMSYEVPAKGTPATASLLLDLVRSGRVDGLLINKSDMLTQDVRVLRNEQCPLVVIESTFDVESLGVPAVATDHHLGGKLAAEHLFALGHQRIALVTRVGMNPPDPRSRYQDVVFLEGVREAAQQQGDGKLTILEGDYFDRAQTVAVIEDLLRLDTRPTGILFGDDILALTALGVLTRAGRRVPEDISVVGYGDAGFAEYAEPSLTTVHVPVAELGRLAVLALIDVLEGRPLARQRQVLSPSLVARGSSGSAPRD